MKMMGKIHMSRCDCPYEPKYVSAAREKCNHRYGVKRQRSREKRAWKRDTGL